MERGQQFRKFLFKYFGNIPNLEIANIFFKYGEPDNNIVKDIFK